MQSLQTDFEQNYGSNYSNSLPLLGQSIVEILAFLGCQNIYGVGGDFAANLISALGGNIPLSPSSNEMHAGFSGCGQAEIDGIGVVLTTYTVGSLPCTSAAALAITEKLPVIFISGAPGEQEIANHTIHHTIASASSWRADYDCALDSFRALGMQSRTSARCAFIKTTEYGGGARLNNILIDVYKANDSAGYPTLCKGRFEVDEQTFHVLEEPTSLNSMALLPDLIDIGIAAIKIEGRQRSSAYVKSVTSTWRKAIDSYSKNEPFNVLPQWDNDLAALSEGSQTTLGAYHKKWQ